VAAKIIGLVRKVYPSNSLLSYNPVFKVAGNAVANILGAPFPEFRKLPPNHLRVRVGAGTRIVNNHAHHLQIGSQFWIECFAKGYLDADADIVEIGCGCGRMAMHLDAEYFSGTYLGIDIDPEMIEYCRLRFPAPRFAFDLSPHTSSTYRGGRTSSGEAGSLIMGQSECRDFVFSTSLFTHLLEGEMSFYLKESFRVLRLNGMAVMSFFCMDYVEKGRPWTFSHQVGNAFIDNESYPEASVAYSKDYIIRLARESGFREVSVSGRPVQSFLIARK
jgi:SAM-dependent methyltransferase